MNTPDDRPVLIERSPSANRPGQDGEPKSVRDAYDAQRDKSGKGGRK